MKNIKMLLLDDDDTLRFNLKLFFEDEGINVTPAESGETALQFVKTNKFDVAVVDIRLPGMNGEEFIQAAKRLDENLKFIIHTGSASYKLPDELAELGIEQNQVFQKPIEDMKSFLEKIKRMTGITAKE